MKRTYGPKKGEQVFYASKNAGKIAGVERHGKRPRGSGTFGGAELARGYRRYPYRELLDTKADFGGGGDPYLPPSKRKTREV